MMTSKSVLLVSLGLLIPAVALAQPASQAPERPVPDTQPDVNVPRRASVEKPQASRFQMMYEDIEIMRQIINRKLGLSPGLIGLNSNCTACHDVSAVRFQGPEGSFMDITGRTGFVNRGSKDSIAAASSLGVAVADLDQDGKLEVFLAADQQGYDIAHASLAVPTNVEGVYLKGQGAVYTLTLPPPSRSRPAPTRKTIGQALNDWERIRRSIRGDEPPPKEAEPVKETTEKGIFAELDKSGLLGITEEVLKILAENGNNFSQLAGDEKITVVFTFREPTRSTANHIQSGNQRPNPLSAWGNQQDVPTTWEADGNRAKFTQPKSFEGLLIGSGSGLAGASGNASTVATAPPQTPASIRDFELLGDLLLKQSKAREAVKAFQRALNLNPPAKQAAALYRKIAQGDLMMEDDSAAKKALEMAAENLKLAGESAKNSGSKALGGLQQAKVAPFLPAKLIISAPKKLLDQAAAGKIPYADFRRQATIEYFGFSNLTQPRDKSTN